ncbi:MAG: hypothetical protein ACI4J7_00855 [Ruminiclostridium sp.]
MKLYGKKRAVEALSRFKSSGRFPHALLILGEEGSGRRTLAEYAAMLYLCENDGLTPCMSCRECTRIEGHIHPDVVYPLDCCGGKYTAEGLRALIAECWKQPNDGRLRICIFERLDEMSVVCQNALLKFIEEPLSFNRYIFTAERKSAILETVVSRLTPVECDKADMAEFSAALSEHNIPADRAKELFALYSGNIGAALYACENPDEAEIYRRTAAVAEAVAEGREYDCGAELAAIKTREELFRILGLLSDIYAEAAAVQAGKPAEGAFAPGIEKIAKRLRLVTINLLYSETCRLYGKSEANPNLRLFAAECCCTLFSAREKEF